MSVLYSGAPKWAKTPINTALKLKSVSIYALKIVHTYLNASFVPAVVLQVCVGGKRRKDEISVDSLDFSKKILHTTWHPHENIIAVAATNNLYIFQDKVN